VVVRDANGALVGPVINAGDLGEVVVLRAADGLMWQVNADGRLLTPWQQSIYFTSNDCSGPAYLDNPLSHEEVLAQQPIANDDEEPTYYLVTGTPADGTVFDSDTYNGVCTVETITGKNEHSLSGPFPVPAAVPGPVVVVAG
jgi:hypothetical protein